MHVIGRFLEGEGEEADKRRHTAFKLIPSVVQASWIIKQAVGQKPVLLGQKLTTKYCRLGLCSLNAAFCKCNTMADHVAREGKVIEEPCMTSQQASLSSGMRPAVRSMALE